MTKRLTVQDNEGGSFPIPVAEGDTLLDVRKEVICLRSRFFKLPNPGHFRFSLEGKQLTIEEERAKLACELVDANLTVLIVSSSTNPLQKDSEDAGNSSDEGDDLKKRKASEMEDSDMDKEQETGQSKVCGETTADQPKVLNSENMDSANSDFNHKNIFDSHVKIDASRYGCKQLLTRVKELINTPELRCFCPRAILKEWNDEIDKLMRRSEPEITIGCVGASGVGKSSLLKAAINDDRVLPTSSSRGCTATVVELRYNKAFSQPGSATIDVYVGHVHFISLKDWTDELVVLIDECCDEESHTVSLAKRDESEASKKAWSKIDAVYGEGTMAKQKGTSKSQVFASLSDDARVIKLLQSNENTSESNILEVSSGRVSGNQKQALLALMKDPASVSDDELRKTQRKWADTFRKSINAYAYRKGDGACAQTWPLISKVVLYGPWDVLSTGACLVDLPGVHDDNAARAQVAETYLERCTLLKVFANIKRAVDDKTAKDLFGEEFKRRLFMKGTYSSLSFACTHSDDCEISEIMDDHEDIAKEAEGRWEKMQMLELLQKDDDELEDEKDNIQERMDDVLSNSEEHGSTYQSKDIIDNLKQQSNGISEFLNLPSTERKLERRKCLRELKILATQIRNEYSRRSLQHDFLKGIEELLSEEQDNGFGTIERALPRDFKLEVHCTAANEYLKLIGVKKEKDGEASCFTLPAQTGVPGLILSVHQATEKFRSEEAVQYINDVGNILGRIYRFASEARADSQTAKRLAQKFDGEMKSMDPKAEEVANLFGKKMEDIVRKILEPSFRLAAMQGESDAMKVLLDWFRCEKRSAGMPHNKGINWATFAAAAKRLGLFASESIGTINLNQELCNPLEKAYFSQWEEVMVTELQGRIENTKKEMLDLYTMLLDAIAEAFGKEGVDFESIQRMKTAAKKGFEATANEQFKQIRRSAQAKVNKLNRSTVHELRKKLEPTYAAVASVDRGKGRASRQADAMYAGGSKILTMAELEPMMSKLQQECFDCIQHVAKSLIDVARTMRKPFEEACCLGWKDAKYMKAMEDPAMMIRVFDSRNTLLPDLVRLCEAHDKVMDDMGIERDPVERVLENKPERYVEAKEKAAKRKKFKLE